MYDYFELQWAIHLCLRRSDLLALLIAERFGLPHAWIQQGLNEDSIQELLLPCSSFLKNMHVSSLSLHRRLKTWSGCTSIRHTGLYVTFAVRTGQG